VGRYCGEDYDDSTPCRPDERNWAMNGTCWKPGCGALRARPDRAAYDVAMAEWDEARTCALLAGEQPPPKPVLAKPVSGEARRQITALADADPGRERPRDSREGGESRG
jgi:hypothetical protein